MEWGASNAFVTAIRDTVIKDLVDELGNVATHVVLIFPRGRPMGFPTGSFFSETHGRPMCLPRGVFLSETHEGNVCRYDPLEVLEWVRREENKQT